MTACEKCGKELTLAEEHMAQKTKRPVCYRCNSNDALESYGFKINPNEHMK